MPRPLVLGNGHLLVCFDNRYVIRDLFYPHVGLHNHLMNHPIQMGIWIDGHFCWLNHSHWEHHLGYAHNALVAHSVHSHPGLSIRLTTQDAVHPNLPCYVREIKVHNLAPEPREVQLFFNQDLCIAASDIGDTAFYYPEIDAIVHYKGHHYFAFGGSVGDKGIHEYATGIKGFKGLEGTWRDAEDGHLSMNPIAQGSVDSTFSLHLEIPGKNVAHAVYWMLCGKDLDALLETHKSITGNDGFHPVILKTTHYWRQWHHTEPRSLSNLSKDCEDLYRKSLMIIRAHTDDGGAIIAAADSDILRTNRATYAYMWPRDAAVAAKALEKGGHPKFSKQFFLFCNSIFITNRPVFLQKYRPDGTLGATWLPWIRDGKPETPFQEDETALVLHALWDYYQQTGDKELLHEIYEPLVAPAANFIASHKDPETGLPLPSWDLWEERHGIHTFTVCSVVLAMRAAAEIATLMNDPQQEVYRNTSEEVLQGLLNHLFDEKRGTFLRGLKLSQDSKTFVPDFTADASALAPLLFDILPPEDPRNLSTLKNLESKLVVHSSVGGFARYENDYYFRVSSHYPGNPWILCTLWFAQAKMKLSKSLEELNRHRHWLEWTYQYASPTGILPEQLHPDTGEPLSVSPLTWSHAEYARTVRTYLDRHQKLTSEASHENK